METVTHVHDRVRARVAQFVRVDSSSKRQALYQVISLIYSWQR